MTTATIEIKVNGQVWVRKIAYDGPYSEIEADAKTAQRLFNAASIPAKFKVRAA